MGWTQVIPDEDLRGSAGDDSQLIDRIECLHEDAKGRGVLYFHQVDEPLLQAVQRLKARGEADRAAFEAWVRRNWPIADLDRAEDGAYMVRSLEDHWTGWKAAKEQSNV